MRQTSVLLVAMGLFAAGTVQAADVSYPLTPQNTAIKWTGTKTKGKHDGGFKKVRGVVKNVEGEGLKLYVEIDCTSIYSDNWLLTQHLKGGDFFSIKTFPKAVFTSTRIQQTAGDNFEVIGELTFLKQKLPIKFPAVIEAGGNLRIKAAFKLNRRSFGMNYGPGKIDDLVEVRVAVNAQQATKLSRSVR